MQLDVNKAIETGLMLKSKGVKYKLGAKAMPPTIPTHLDCSGFVRYCYKVGGATIPDGTYYQFNQSEKVDKLQVGDLGFLQLPTDRGTNHIGIYLGDGMWMHCNFSRNGITVEKTNMFKYHRRIKGITYKTEEVEEMAKATEKEKGYGKMAIENLAKNKIINSPESHLQDLDGYMPSWKAWVILNNIYEALKGDK